MSRIKRGTTASKRRKNLLEMAKGYKWRRKSHYRAAKEAVKKAGTYAYRDRRAKKRTNRLLWITRLNNAVRLLGLTYRELIHIQKTKGVVIDRKTLSQLAVTQPKIFEKFIEAIRK